MGRHVEPLTGGLVTDRDPAQLNKGQLSYIRNMVYKQGATSLRTAPGRLGVATAATAQGGVYGLRDMQFDNGMHYLVAGVEDMYRYMDINNPGTFSTIVSGQATGKNIEAVQFRNRYYLLNGATSNEDELPTNQVVYLTATATACSPTARNHGMLSVQAAPQVATATGVFSQSVTGYYEYWATEVRKYTQDGQMIDLESAFNSSTGPSTIWVSSQATVMPVIKMPAVRNPSRSTHFRVYRSPKKDTLTAAKFPVGFKIAEFSTAITGFADSTGWVGSASSYPSAFNTGGVGSTYGDFTTASAMKLADGNYASAAVGVSLATKTQGVYGFDFGQSSAAHPEGPVGGIKIELKAYVSAGTAPCPVDVAIGIRSRVTGRFSLLYGTAYNYQGKYLTTKTAQITGTSPGTATIITLGGEGDTWVPAGNPYKFVDTDFQPWATSNDDQFMVAISVSKPGASIGIDYVKAYVYYGAPSDSTVVYPTVVYQESGVTVQVARNGTPPSASTGDIFNDALVLNDTANKSIVRYSVPGEPDYFPPTYYLDFETKSNDVVQCIRVVNNRLIVGLDNQLWRVNYLPSERDASFDRGKAIDNISGQYGIVNSMCATTITIEGQAETLAFVSNFGLHTTDGYNIVTRSKNLTWTYSGSLGTPVALLNDTENRCLRIYYHQDGDLDKELCLWASYDRGDIDAEGNFKFSGPVSMANYVSSGKYGKLQTAWNVIKSDGASRFYMGYSSATAGGGGMVYQENSEGYGTIPGYTSNYQYKTRRMYLNGIGGEWMVDDMYGYCGTYTGTPLLTYTFDGTKTNLPSSAHVSTSKSITLAGQELHRVSPKIAVEGLMVTGVMTYPFAVDYGQESIVISSKSLGYEDSGL